MKNYAELIEALRYLAKVYSICENENTQEYQLAVQAADAIEKLTVAHQQRMRGRWSGPFCTKCGISKYNFVKILHTDDGPCGKWNFCPNCGAQMEGQDE